MQKLMGKVMGGGMGGGGMPGGMGAGGFGGGGFGGGGGMDEMPDLDEDDDDDDDEMPDLVDQEMKTIIDGTRTCHCSREEEN